MNTTAAPADEASSQSQRRAASWTRYWRTGALHSCGSSFDGNYAGALRAFWLEVFDALPVNPRVLDLCCGNAPLSLLLLNERPSRLGKGSIGAVDLADIAPPWLAQRSEEDCQRVHVHSQTSVQQLPMESGSADLCMSQYGIEYAGDTALDEIYRVLRPRGRLAAVVHHIDALPVRIARVELGHLDWATNEARVLAHAADMVEPMARSATAAGQASLRSDAHATKLRAAFNGMLNELGQRITSAPYPDVLLELRDAVMAAVQVAQRSGKQAADAALATLQAELEESRLRQAELVSHALRTSELHAWATRFGDAAPRIEALPFDQGGIAGWAVILQRRDS